MTFSSSLFVVAATVLGQVPETSFVHHFRDGAMPPPDRMVMVGVDNLVEVMPEKGGLRIKVLANRGKDGAGMQSKFSLKGDFEITASYEVLAVDRPTTGYGAGVYLTIAPAAQNKRAGLARCWSPQDRVGFKTSLLGADVPAKISWAPAETNKGQLRLRREGASLRFLVNDDLGQPFREVFQADYGTDEIESVRFVVNPGNSPAAVDARLIDIEMHWGALPNELARVPVLPGADGNQVLEAQKVIPSRGRLATYLCVGLAITLSIALVVVLVFYARRRRQMPTA